MSTMNIVLIVVAALVAPIFLSMLVEALRKAPQPPARLSWDPHLPVNYIEVAGNKLRFIKTGTGPALVLLHTLRTQFDIFHKLIPELSKRFTVYALDYPGHGWSDIPATDYQPELFVSAVEGFLEALDINDATLAGVSIGGTIPLLIAAKKNPRIRKVIAVNPYDYGAGGGLGRSSLLGGVLFTLGKIPIVGETFMRFRNRVVEDLIFSGGVASPRDISPELRKEMYQVGARPGHYRAFLNLLRHAHRWDDAHAVYGDIAIPVLLVYGENDWTNDNERQRTLREIAGARLETVPGGSHFLSLDRPAELQRLISEFALS
jgi:pimeloyl-ACP methyl ester carboxylesterase